MNRCIVCGKMFKPKPEYKERRTCSYWCYCQWAKQNVPQGFKNNQFQKGQEAFNKGIPQSEWMSEESREKCSKTHIQYQETAASPLSKEEGVFLPYNTLKKGTVTRRKVTHKKGKNKGKTEIVYYINIDWHGNRKPNNLYKRYLWELHNQMDLPKGYVVAVIDGDPDNIVIENLELISRKELLRRNNGGQLGRRWN